jgi:MYXO-CTERM domain-containing protein
LQIKPALWDTSAVSSANADYVTFSFDGVHNAVPEADTYAMLLAGLGLAGFAARRRRQA